jgi:hypothetical protein
MLGTEAFVDVLKQMSVLIKQGDQIAMDARRAVPSSTKPEHVPEEILAYLVQHHPELPFVQRVIAAIRAWAYKNLDFARSKMELTTADMQALATAALRKVAREADARVRGETRYSESGLERLSRDSYRGGVMRHLYKARDAIDSMLSEFKVMEVERLEFGQGRMDTSYGKATPDEVKAALDEFPDIDAEVRSKVVGLVAARLRTL